MEHFAALHESGFGAELASRDLRSRVSSRRQKQTRYAQSEPFGHDPGCVKTPACLARVEHLKAIAPRQS